MSFRGGGRQFGQPEFQGDYKPSELYPQMAVPAQSEITDFERQSVGQFLVLRTAIKDGPLSTGSSSDKGRVVVEIEGNNDGIKRYSDRYLKKRKIGRTIDEHPYVMKFFPDELHPIMGVSKTSKKKKKNLQISKFTRDLINASKGDNTEEDSEKDPKKKSVLERIAQAEQEAGDDDDEEENGESDDIDDDFSEDEFDDGDYNAEKYFDDGDAEFDDDGGDDEGAF